MVTSKPFDRPLLGAVHTALADTPVVCVLGPGGCKPEPPKIPEIRIND